jgi:hypothetical protein
VKINTSTFGARSGVWRCTGDPAAKTSISNYPPSISGKPGRLHQTSSRNYLFILYVFVTRVFRSIFKYFVLRIYFFDIKDANA